MRRLFVLIVLLILAGCSSSYPGMTASEEPTILVYSQLDATLSSYSEQLKLGQTWELERAYTGMILLPEDQILFYGYGLDTAGIYNLRTGELLAEVETPEGTVGGYSDEYGFYLANSQTNTVTIYDFTFNEIKQIQTGRYPMSITSQDAMLYVVNYQDDHLTLIDQVQWEIHDEFSIPRASQGVKIHNDSIYIGGHGSGSEVNTKVIQLDKETGEVVTSIEAPIMPISFITHQDELYTLSHGSNQLYRLDEQSVTDEMEVASNPFAMGASQEFIYLAGYDDDTLYKINEMEVVDSIPTGDGPLQLLLWEGSK